MDYFVKRGKKKKQENYIPIWNYLKLCFATALNLLSCYTEDFEVYTYILIRNSEREKNSFNLHASRVEKCNLPHQIRIRSTKQKWIKSECGAVCDAKLWVFLIFFLSPSMNCYKDLFHRQNWNNFIEVITLRVIISCTRWSVESIAIKSLGNG